MTDKQLFAVIRSLGLVAKKVEGEYRISLPVEAVGRMSAEASACYTNDRADALDTARVMAGTWMSGK